MRNFLRYLFIFVLACFCFITIDDVYAEIFTPPVETLSVWWNNPSGGGGQNVNNFSTTPPSYPAFKRFRVHYGTGQFGNSNFTGDLCFSSSFGVKAVSDIRDIKNYNKLDNWSFGDQMFYLRYVDVYYSNDYLYYTFYMQNNSNVTGFYYSYIDFYYVGTINPYFTNQAYTFAFTTPVTRFVSCSSISDNMIDSELDNLHSEIDNSFNEINNKIDDVQSSIINNQEQNKQEIIDNANQNHQEAEDTRKGIWASLTDGIANIGKWFSDLASSIGNFFKELGDGIANGFTSLFDSIKSLFVGEEVCEIKPPTLTNLINYDSVQPDSDGWYTYTCTTSDCPQYTVPYIDSIKNATYYNAFFEIKDLISNGNYRIQPFFSYSGQFGSSALFPYFVSNGNLTVENKSIISKDNSLFNQRTTYAYLGSYDYFTKFSVSNYTGSNLSFKFRVLVTDDMSMTVDNYEYPLPKEECTTKGGLFGMLSDFFSFITDDTPADSDVSVLGNVQGLLPPGPLDSLLNIPFQFLSVLTSSFGGVCVPLSGTFVFDSTLTLPCFSEMFYDNVPSYLMNFISLIPSGFLLIKYFKHLYKKVDRAVNLNANADDEWGVL